MAEELSLLHSLASQDIRKRNPDIHLFWVSKIVVFAKGNGWKFVNI